MSPLVLPQLNFDDMNEADVRAEVIDPVLRSLGYCSGTDNNILRERQIELRYTKMFLGRKNSRKDVILRGRPDYICEVRGLTRWALEAKPPSEDITHDDVQQAHSYAFHPDLCAPLFILCNGKSFHIYETQRGPASSPLALITYDELRQKPYLLDNILGPTALRRRFPPQHLDLGEPLADGFGSVAKILGGFTRYDEIEMLVEGLPPGTVVPGQENIKRLVGYEAGIIGDACYRDSSGVIVADLEMQFPHGAMRDFAVSLGIDKNRYTTTDARVSQSPEMPSTFEYSNTIHIPAGVTTFNILNFATEVVPMAMNLAWYAEAVGAFDGQLVQER